MDPFLEKTPVFHELHTQLLAAVQGQLQLQIRPRYVARLERHLSEGVAWGLEVESLDRKEPDVTIVEGTPANGRLSPATAVAEPTVATLEEIDPEELELRKQRRIVIYVNQRPRLAVTSIELLSPSNKQAGAVARERYLEKRSSALHGGLHWVEIDLLRGGVRPPMPVEPPADADYLTYVAQATAEGWRHLLYTWRLRDALPKLPIPLLGDDSASIDLAAAFQEAYDRIAGDDEADYASPPPAPPLRGADVSWVEDVVRGAAPSRAG
jgi:hypothetical protein